MAVIHLVMKSGLMIVTIDGHDGGEKRRKYHLMSAQAQGDTSGCSQVLEALKV